MLFTFIILIGLCIRPSKIGPVRVPTGPKWTQTDPVRSGPVLIPKKICISVFQSGPSNNQNFSSNILFKKKNLVICLTIIQV